MIKELKKLKEPKILIIDEPTNTIIFNPSRYELMKAAIKIRENRKKNKNVL